MKNKLKKVFQEIGVMSLSLAIAFVLVMGVSIARGWVPAPADPPNSNVGAPINTSIKPQTKDGDLTIGGKLTSGTLETIGNAILNTGGGYPWGLLVNRNLWVDGGGIKVTKGLADAGIPSNNDIGIISDKDICTNFNGRKCLSNAGSSGAPETITCAYQTGNITPIGIKGDKDFGENYTHVYDGVTTDASMGKCPCDSNPDTLDCNLLTMKTSGACFDQSRLNWPDDHSCCNYGIAACMGGEFPVTTDPNYCNTPPSRYKTKILSKLVVSGKEVTCASGKVGFYAQVATGYASDHDHGNAASCYTEVKPNDDKTGIICTAIAGGGSIWDCGVKGVGVCE